jgi:hypothetical protein
MRKGKGVPILTNLGVLIVSFFGDPGTISITTSPGISAKRDVPTGSM